MKEFVGLLHAVIQLFLYIGIAWVGIVFVLAILVGMLSGYFIRTGKL